MIEDAARGPSLTRSSPKLGASWSPRPRSGVVDVAVAVVAVGLGATVGISLTAETRTQFDGNGGIAIFAGNVTGLVGTYLALVMVLLVSRIPWVERVLGQDGLLRWHRRLAAWPILLIAAHAFLLTIGYAQAARSGILHEVGTLVSGFAYMAIATVAFVIMMLIGAVSVRAVRSRMKRESWWALHLFMYLALALAFAHEVVLGPSFVGHPLTRFVWSVAWAATAGVVIVCRFGIPIVRSVRHRLVVAEVRPEASGVVSIHLKGRHLDRLSVSGGQFFEWRFLRRGMWWQAHPFSVSATARSNAGSLRLTVKNVGDFTAALAAVPVGTRVAIEGPYGAFTAHAQRRQRVLLVAGGIGVTAVRGVLEDLPAGCEPVVVLRASDVGSLALGDEVAALVERHHGTVHELVGSREAVPVEAIGALVADLKERDAYVAGPEGFVEAVVEFLSRAGVPVKSIHSEIYAL